MTPVYFTSTFVQASPGVFKDGYDYARSKNPTRTALEANLAALEGGTHGFTCSSRLAALDCPHHLLRAGDHVVLSDDVYGGTFRQLDKVFRHLNLTTTRVDMTKLDEISKAIRPETRLVWLETPSNPMLKVIDIAGVRKVVDAAKIGPSPAADTTLGPLGTSLGTTLGRPMLVVDNTFASP
ncbi:MAG: PLP-dependent transferase, partial [Phycisphaerae bacterium]